MGATYSVALDSYSYIGWGGVLPFAYAPLPTLLCIEEAGALPGPSGTPFRGLSL